MRQSDIAASFIDNKTEACLSKLPSVSEQLRGFPLESWHCTFFSVAHQWDYWMQHLLPEVSMPSSVRIDDAVSGAR